jgi:hypothetical protein
MGMGVTENEAEESLKPLANIQHFPPTQIGP